MLWTLGEMIGFARGIAPRELVPAATLDQIGTIPDVLPRALAVGAFECRLEPGAPRADFSVCVGVPGGGRGAMRDGPPLSMPADAGWQAVRRFLHRWLDPASLVFHAVSVAWLEFDVDESSPRPPTPFPFLVLQDPPGTPSPREYRASAALALGRELAGAVPAALGRCLAALPPGAQLLHVAAMPARSTGTLRVVAAMSPARLAAYLDDVGWPGPTSELAARLAALGAPTDHLPVHLDVGATVGRRIGVEYHFPGSPRADPRWRRVLDHLVAAGACTPEKRRAVAAWVEDAELDTRPQPWPVRLVRDYLMVKVVQDADAPARAKAYLPFTPHVTLW